MRVLEFKHIGPFDGCFHCWEYLAVGSNGEVFPIIFTEGRLSPREVVFLSQGAVLRNQYRHYKPLFRDFTWFVWDDPLFHEVPFAYIPRFRRFAARHGLEFTWWCDVCRRPQTGIPVKPSGWKPVGGCFVEVIGWICRQCQEEIVEHIDGRP